jgi:type IV secretory pathway TrbD component
VTYVERRETIVHSIFVTSAVPGTAAARGIAVTRWDSAAGLGGLAVPALAGVVTAMVLVGLVKNHRWLLGAAGGALAFQAVHLVEHGAQALYWVGHRTSAPYLTPWATSARDGLAFWCHVWAGKGVAPARGNELMHLAGNSVFLAGAVAMVILARRLGRDRSVARAARGCAWLQAAHVCEHVALTATLFIGGSARGLSTLFGTLPATDPFLVGYRIWFHFAINLVATVLAVRAARQLADAGVLGTIRTVIRRPAKQLGLAGA